MAENMKSLSALSALVLYPIFLISCSMIFTDQRIRESFKTGEIRIGNSQADVVRIIGRPGDSCVRTRMAPDGNYELWDYGYGNCGVGNLVEAYALIFRDGILVEIRTVRSELDMKF